MSVKLILLKSGEDIVSDVQEMVIGEDDNAKVVGYFLKKPCIVKMRSPSQPPQKNSEDTPKNKASFEVALYPWLPLTSDEIIPIPTDWVVTITEPVEKLKDMYVKEVINYGKTNEDSSTNEQFDSDQSD